MKILARKFYFVELSPREAAFNRSIDRVTAWIDKWLITPFLGKAPIQ